jgi:hypothetical protein
LDPVLQYFAKLSLNALLLKPLGSREAVIIMSDEVVSHAGSQTCDQYSCIRTSEIRGSDVGGKEVAEVGKMVKKHRKGVPRMKGEETNEEMRRGSPCT